MKKYIIRPIPLSEGPRERGRWTYLNNYGQVITSCSFVWYIEGAATKILIDTGARTESFLARGLKQREIQTLDQGLAGLGFKPEDVDIVILTHLHWDHVELAHEFTRAKFIVQKSELEYANNPHQVSGYLYDPRMFRDLRFQTVPGDTEIVEGIRVLHTPGHSPGGQSVAIDTSGGTAIITGFCCLQENFEPSPEMRAKGFDVVIPGLHTNTEQAYDSALRVKRSADIIIPLHEVSFKDRKSVP